MSSQREGIVCRCPRCAPLARSHPASIRRHPDQVFAALPDTTPERQALNAALSQCVATVRRLQLADQIILGGSFVTSKPDPADVDMVVLTPGVYQLAGEQRYAAEGIDIILLDIQFAHDAADFQGWLMFFSTARVGQ